MPVYLWKINKDRFDLRDKKRGIGKICQFHFLLGKQINQPLYTRNPLTRMYRFEALSYYIQKDAMIKIKSEKYLTYKK